MIVKSTVMGKLRVFVTSLFISVITIAQGALLWQKSHAAQCQVMFAYYFSMTWLQALLQARAEFGGKVVLVQCVVERVGRKFRK